MKKIIVMFFALFLFIGIDSVRAETCLVGDYMYSFSGDRVTSISYWEGDEVTGSWVDITDEKNVKVQVGFTSCPSASLVKVIDSGNNIIIRYKECGEITDQASCTANHPGGACEWKYYRCNDAQSESGGNGSADKISCGNFPPINKKIPEIVSTIVNIMFVAVPIILIIFGMIDLMKGVSAAKEDEIAKGRKTFVKRLITGVLVFFVFYIVKLIVSVASDGGANESKNIIECMDCFINGNCVNNNG